MGPIYSDLHRVPTYPKLSTMRIVTRHWKSSVVSYWALYCSVISTQPLMYGLFTYLFLCKNGHIAKGDVGIRDIVNNNMGSRYHLLSMVV